MENISHERLHTIQRCLLFSVVLCLPFSSIPRTITISLIGSNLVYYPLLLGLICFAYECWKEKQIDIPCKYVMFCCICICWQCACTIVGILTYEYYYLIDIEQIPKLEVLTGILASHNIFIPEVAAIKSWLLLRFIKDVLKNNILIFGCIFWIYHLYYCDWKKGFTNLRKAFLLLVGMLSCYSVIEIAYLQGNGVALNVLSYINPFLYDVASDHGWWPRLLWAGQLRSMFAEPSFFGMVAAAIVPFLFSYILEKIQLKYLILYAFFVFMIFLTKARTATLLFCGELILLISCLIGPFKAHCFKIMVIVLCSAIAFIGSLLFIPVENTSHSQETLKVSKYIEENVLSVQTGQRSNTARYANTIATFQVGIDHPVFGVGEGLTSAYVGSNIPQWGNQNQEIKLWVRYLHKDGPLKAGFPILNQFAGILAKFGIVGFLLYIVPLVYLAVNFIRKKKYKEGMFANSIFIAFLGSTATLLGNEPFFSLYIVMGLLLCVVDGETNERTDV